MVFTCRNVSITFHSTTWTVQPICGGVHSLVFVSVSIRMSSCLVICIHFGFHLHVWNIWGKYGDIFGASNTAVDIDYECFDHINCYTPFLEEIVVVSLEPEQNFKKMDTVVKLDSVRFSPLSEYSIFMMIKNKLIIHLNMFNLASVGWLLSIAVTNPKQRMSLFNVYLFLSL